MNIKSINTEAACIVGRAAFSKLDCNNEGELSAHVGCAFECWNSDHIRNGADSQSRDEFRYSVRQALHALGFVW